VKRFAGERPTIVVTTDVNGTTTPDKTFLSRDLRTRICEIDFAADEKPDYARAGDVIREALWKTLRTQL